MQYCPRCTTELTTALRGGLDRLICPAPDCGFVFWDNPAPVVAGIVEFDSRIVLIRNVGWPAGWYGLVTGFLEKNESPEAGIVREVKEETGLDATVTALIGLYPFERMNQLIIAYHLEAHSGDVVIDPVEIEDHRWIPVDRVQPWDSSTGLALADWLRRHKGLDRPVTDFRSASAANVPD